MPDAQTLATLDTCFRSCTALFNALGPWWTGFYAVSGAGLGIGFLYWRSSQADKPWERLVATKDAMIDQINEQNRELRVQALVVGGRFTKAEAARLVYGDDRLDPKPSGPKQ